MADDHCVAALDLDARMLDGFQHRERCARSDLAAVVNQIAEIEGADAFDIFLGTNLLLDRHGFTVTRKRQRQHDARDRRVFVERVNVADDSVVVGVLIQAQVGEPDPEPGESTLLIADVEVRRRILANLDGDQMRRHTSRFEPLDFPLDLGLDVPGYLNALEDLRRRGF